MSGSIKTRSMAKGNEAMRGDAPAAPDNPGNSRIRQERGHEACAPSDNTTMMQRLASLLFHRSMELGQNQYGSASLEQPGSVPTMSEWPGSIQTTSNEARMMQMAASSMFDDYRAENGPGSLRMSSSVPTTSNDTRMVQRIAPSSLFSVLSVGYGNSSQGNPTEIRAREQKEPGFNF